MRVWFVDLLVAVRVLPLQCLSLVVVTLPWTLPRLLALQLANPASVIEGGLETAKVGLRYSTAEAIICCIRITC